MNAGDEMASIIIHHHRQHLIVSHTSHAGRGASLAIDAPLLAIYYGNHSLFSIMYWDNGQARTHGKYKSHITTSSSSHTFLQPHATRNQIMALRSAKMKCPLSLSLENKYIS
jgi:hypothetical protein